MVTVFLVITGTTCIGILLFLIAFLVRKRVGLPTGDITYSDSTRASGEILNSTTLPLVGKPDFILEKDGFFIPVEVKTGKTPKTPYKNHLAQLFAYCLLIEETYQKRPPYGIIQYPEASFPLEFTQEAEQGIKQVIQEILEKKQNGTYRDAIANRCQKCRGEHHERLTSLIT